MANNPAKHEFVDDYPYLAYASEVDTVAESGEGGGGSYTLPIASADTLGGVKVGEGLAINENGTLSAEGGEAYTLPVASADTLGGVKVGEGLAIDENGILSSSSNSDIFYVSAEIDQATNLLTLSKNTTELNTAIEAGKEIVLQATTIVPGDTDPLTITSTSKMIDYYSFVENDVTNYGYTFIVSGVIYQFEASAGNYPTRLGSI